MPEAQPMYNCSMATVTGIKVIWPDGSETEARSATEFILRSAQEQWSKTSHQEMKNQFSKRAKAVSGKFIHPHQPDDSFIRELARVGLIGLEVQ